MNALVDAAPQDLVITMLGAHLHPREGGTAWSGGLVALLAEFGFSEGAARVALTRLVRRDLLARSKQGRTVHYTATPRALAVLAEGDRRIFSLGRDDGADRRWTVLWHAIPEDRRTERTRLVRRLRFLGFGPVQDGTWIAARDHEREVAALLADLGVAGHAGMMLAEPGRALDFGGFVTRVWDLDGLGAAYGRFVAEFAGVDPAALDLRAAFVQRTRLVHGFRRFPLLDPELPAALVPAPVHRTAAVELFHSLYPALADPARRFFDGKTRP